MGSPLGPSLFPEEREQPTRDPLTPASSLAPSLFPDTPDPLQQTITQGPAPDRAARVRQIAQETQLPADVVDRNFDSLAKARTLPPTVDLPTLPPKLREWLEADRTRAIAAAHDPTVPALAHRLTWGESLARGLDHLQQRFGGFLEHAGELDRVLLGKDVLGLIPVGREMRLRNEAEANAYGPATSFDAAFRGPWDFLQWTKEQVGDTLPAMVPNVAAASTGAAIGSFFGPEGTLIGGIIGALIPAGVQGIGDVQTTLKEIDPNAEAPVWVFVGGSAVGAFDSVLPGHVGGRLVTTFGTQTAEQIARQALLAPVKPQFLRTTAKGIVTGMATEGLTEGLQDAIGLVVGYTGAGQPIDWSHVREVAKESATAGAIIGGLFDGGTTAIEHRRARAHYAAAQQQQAFFQALGQSVEGSTLAEQLPADLQDLVGHLTKDGPIATVYAPTETFVEYFQSKGIAPAIAAQELTGSPTALADAQASGVDLAIPMGAYAAKIAPTEHNTYFAKELRLSPTSLNLREVEEATAQVADAAAASQTTEQDQARERVRARAQTIADRISSQARGAGQRPADAAALGTFYAQVYAALGVRLKQDPVTLFERRPLAVQLAEGETFIPNVTVDAPGSTTIPASVAPSNESIEARATRRTAHRAALVAQAIREARRVDPEVDPAVIRAELTFRLDALEDQQDLVRDSGRDPIDLLRAVADAGGIWWEERTGAYRGEIELLKDGAAFGRINGVNGVVRKEGRPPDTMVEILRQDPRFQWIEDLNQLLDALDLASRPDTAGGRGAVDQFPGTEELADAGVMPGTRWWDDRRAAPVEAIAEDEIDFDDVSFNPEEFAQRRMGVARARQLLDEEGFELDGEPGNYGLYDARVSDSGRNAGGERRPTQRALRALAVINADRGEFYQRKQPDADDFFSRITRAVETARQAKASGAQWKATIRNAGVNQDEWRLVTVDTLEDGRSYTRDEVLAHLRAHEVRVSVVTLQEQPYNRGQVEALADKLYNEAIDERVAEALNEGAGAGAYVEIEEDDDGGWAVVKRSHQGSVIEDDLVDTEQEAEQLREQWEDQLQSNHEDSIRDAVAQDLDYDDYVQQAEEQLGQEHELARTQYASYTEPGGDPGSYREVFITAPGPNRGFEQLSVAENQILATPYMGDRTFLDLLKDDIDIPGRITQTIFQLERRQGNGPSLQREAESKVLGVLRVLKQLADGGNPLTFREAWYDGHDDYAHIENPIVRLRFNTRTSADGTRTLFLEEVQPPHEGEFEKMPEAFQKAWRELAFKWALKHAATLGVDRLAWTSGAMQAKRYNLRQVVDLIEYFPHSQQLVAYKPDANALRYRVIEDNGRFVLLDQHGRRYQVTYPTEERALDAKATLDRYVETFRHYDVEAEDLPRYIGKELADRLLAQTPQGKQLPEVRPMADGRWTVINPETGVGSIYDTEEIARRSAEAKTPRRYTLEGQQLEVGGEGLTRLYDHDFVNVVRKLTKKAGADVGAFPVPFETRETPMPANTLVTRASLDAWRKRHPTQQVTRLAPGVAITPALREQFLGAQPLLSDEGGRVKGAFNPSTNVLRLVAGQADLSTFLHESGHYFLEVLTDLALEVDETSADAEQRQVRTDAETLLRYAGFTGTLQDWKALPTDARRDQHELFARTFEQYLFDGRAPSSELRALFARFRRWLSGVYDKLRGLGIDIPDDVRGVLDRLVATDDAIAEVQAEGELVPLFTDPAAAGVDDLTFEAYRGSIAQAHQTAREAIDRRLLAEWRKEQQADWQQERGTVRQAIVDEVQQNPLLRALSVMRTGKLPDGSIPDFGDGRPLKLDREALVAQYGKGLLDRLPRSPRNYLYAREGGLPPDTLAELLGFGSGDALVRALVDAPKASVARIIDAEADRRMRQRRGDQLLDGLSLHDVAEQAVYDARREVIAAELRALTQGMTQAALPPAAAVNAEALKRINATKVRDLKPGLFLQASRRASRQAFEAFASNDRAAAIAAKQQELTALALYRVAMDAKERVAKARSRLQDYASKVSTRSRIAKAGQHYLDQIDAFLERYELTKVTQKQIDRRQSLRQFLASLERQGLPHDIPDDVVDDARRVNWQELPVDELLGVADNVDQIAHLARIKGKLLKAARARELAAVTAEVASSIYEHNRKRPETIEPRHVSQRLARGLDGFIASHRKIASLAREFDGFQAGPMWEYVIRPINTAADEETQQKAAATTALRGIFDRFFPRDRNFTSKQYIPALGGPENPRASLSREARLVAALNWGNETNRSRLLLGHNWTTAQAQAVLDTLTKTEWDFVQAIWDYYDTFWPAIADKQRRVIGVAPEKVDAIPVFTRFGEYRGGYHPIKWEGQLQASSQAFADAEVGNVQKLAAYANATTKRNHTKARTEGEVRRPVRLDFGTVFEHVGEVIHDLTHHEMLIDVNRVIREDAVSKAIYDTHGEAAYRQFKLALQDIAVGDVPARDEVEAFLNHLRTGSTVVGLGYNLVTAALQPIGLTQSAQRIGAKWVAVGLSDWMRGIARREHTLEWVREKSAFMRGRGETMNREIREIRSHIGVDTGRVSGWVDEALRTVSADRVTKQGIADSYFRLIQVMQITADMPTWLGEYHRAINDPGNVDDAGRVDEARAIALADQAVRDAQGSGEIASLARVQRGGPYLKLWTNFYSFFNTTFNLWWESQRRARGRRWTPAAIGHLAVDYLLLFAIPATVGELVRAAFKGDLDDPEQLAENIALGNAAYMLGSFLIGRELGGALSGFDYSGPAGSRAIATASRLMKQLPRALSDASEGEYERLAKVAAGAGFDTAGALFHFPSVQLRKTFSGLWALMEGRTDNPLALVSGPAEDER